ncbi:MAG: crosslink repair DNA glycosylase YcaQ family protein [Tetrasphaera sp.]
MVDLPTLRAYWAHRQGLDGSLAGANSAAVLERAGWARSVGGTTPYLTLFSRAGLRRDQVDADVAALRIHELPSARDCTYVLPAADFALAAVVGGGASSAAELRTAAKLGVTREEIDDLADQIVAALARQESDPAALRKTLGQKVRSLGDEGKKKGVTTTLPLALGVLQAQSRIRRVPIDGRLDQQRFRYTVWSDAPAWGGSREDAAADLASRYWAWIGVASLAQFRWFSAFTATAAKKATADLALRPVGDAGLLATAETITDLESSVAPNDPQVSLIGWLDSLVLLRRDLDGVTEAADRAHPLLAPARGTSAGGSLTDLPHQGIVDRGRLIGLWDYDPELGEIAWAPITDLARAQRESVEDAVARTAAYVREDLGDNRGMSLDSPKARAPRLAQLRAHARR